MSSDVVEELENVCVLCRVLCGAPCGGGVHLPFIGQGEGELQTCSTVQLCGEAWCATPQSRRPP
jgi:hypothetical protein